MKRPPVDLFFVWLMVGALAVFGLPVGCTFMAKGELNAIERLRLHQQTITPGKRELRLQGKLHGGKIVTSPAGASCLGWVHSIYANRSTSSGGKSKTERKLICGTSHVPETPSIELLDHQQYALTGLRFAYSTHPIRGSLSTGPAIPCPALTKSDMSNATVVEYCLQDGDKIEAWACLHADGKTLGPCGDAADTVYAPPGEGPIASLKNKALSLLCGGSIWLLLGGMMLYGMLLDRVQRTRRAPKGTAS